MGEPNSGPGAAVEGLAVAATILGGNYDVGTDSRLISPLIELPDVNERERIELRFWQWYSYNIGDKGQVQISEWTGSGWGSWVGLRTTALSSDTSDWSRIRIDLSAYAASQFRISFYHTAVDWWNKSGPDVSSGWYLDEVEISAVQKSDVNGDGEVDREDLALFFERWLDSGCAAGNDWCGFADFSQNGSVNFEDFATLANQY